MKNKSIVLLLFVLSLSLYGCSEKAISRDEAKTHINSFFAAIEAGDYTQAETHLHPDRLTPVEEYINSVEEPMNVSFQSGIKIEKYTGFSSAFYDSTVKGATYTLNMNTVVENVNLKMTIEVVRNESGFGIYNFNIKS